MRWSPLRRWAGCALLAVLPILFPSLRLVPLMVAVMLVALRQSRAAWVVAISSALMQEWISVVPPGAHLIEGAAAVLMATIALRRVVSSSTWAQLGLACGVSLMAAEMALWLWEVGWRVVGSTSIIPSWFVFVWVGAQHIVVAMVVTMVTWPFIRSRWAPLHRLPYER